MIIIFELIGTVAFFSGTATYLGMMLVELIESGE